MRIKEILAAKNMSAKELASKCGLSEMGLSKILRGKSHPNANTIIIIAKALDVTCGQLFDDYSEEYTMENKESSSEDLVCPHCGKPIKVKLET